MSTGVIGIINFGMGNILSVQNAFNYLNQNTVVVGSPSEIEAVDKLVLPGVGAFGRAITYLAHMGFIEALNEAVLYRKKPILGICLGMQLICRESSEFGVFQGLRWIDAPVARFPNNPDFRIPHVGWNSLEIHSSTGILRDVPNGSDVYFVHSYFVDSDNQNFVKSSCTYGQRFAAVIEHENIFATQFHPEKSQRAGLTVLKNFSLL